MPNRADQNRAAQTNSKQDAEQQMLARLDLARAKVQAETAAHAILSATEGQIQDLSLDGCLRLLHAMASEPDDERRGDVRMARLRLYRSMDLPRDFITSEKTEWQNARNNLTNGGWLGRASTRWSRHRSATARMKLMNEAVQRMWVAHGTTPPKLVPANKGQPVRHDPGSNTVSVPVRAASMRDALNQMLLPLSEARAEQLASNTPTRPRWPVHDGIIGGRLMLRYNQKDGAFIGPDFERRAHAGQPLSQYAKLMVETVRPSLATRNWLGKTKVPKAPKTDRKRAIGPGFSG
ncbi:MAG: hypothetical protein Alpg2KO_22020 [Alphaproteobacteria bacterium]